MKHRYSLILSSVFCAILIAAGYFSYRKLPAYIEKRHILSQLSSTDYSSVFLSMYDVSTFPVEIFAINRGIPTLKPDYCLQNAKELEDALRSVFSSGNAITNVFLGLDPFSFLQSVPGSAGEALLTDSEWTACINTNPNVSFEVLFSFPSKDYWMSVSETERDRVFALLKQLIDLLDAKSNVTMYYVGGEDWLICNPANYTASFTTTRSVSEKLFLYTFCDGYFKITSENAPEILQQTRHKINSEITAPTEYPDLKDTAIVFFGDSLFGNYTDSMSIPGAVRGLTGAAVYNCGYGGNSAAMDENTFITLPGIAAAFTQQDLSALPPDTQVYAGVSEYISNPAETDKLCFVISYGLNDYFNGHPIVSEDPLDITTYSGAVRTAVICLQKYDPQAQIILCTPTYTARGTEWYPLEDYVNAVIDLARELDVDVIDNYRTLGIDKSNYQLYLSDLVHPNEAGRFLFAQKIISAVGR